MSQATKEPTVSRKRLVPTPSPTDNPTAYKPDQIVEVPDVKYSRAGARFWHSMGFSSYISMLSRNRFRISFLRWGMSFLLLNISLVNSFLNLLQTLLFAKKIRETELSQPPIFVVGHWRSGTTLLHELLSLDSNFGYPTTWECFAPKHFLVSSSWMPAIVAFSMPAKRPMDSMDANFDAPQEDEFALLAMGAPSPYFRMAFPNDPPPYREFYAMTDCEEEDVAKFDDALTHFFKALTFKNKRRLVLKSPTHTGRIAHLAKLFPGAKFIHIARHPHKQLSSTLRMWHIMDEIQHFQKPRYTQQELLDQCFETFHEMYDEGYLQQVESIAESDRCEIRFEDLLADPESEIAKIYEALGLGDSKVIRTRVREYFGNRTDYKRNKHELSAHTKSEINENCKAYMQKYDYQG